MCAELLVVIYSTGHERRAGEVQEGDQAVAEEILKQKPTNNSRLAKRPRKAESLAGVALYLILKIYRVQVVFQWVKFKEWIR